MRHPVGVSKITPPRLPRIVERLRLIERLERNSDKSLILILGQAAQGKSTLAASFLQATSIPSAWVNLHEEDSDPVNLFYSIVYSIQYALKDADVSPLLSYPAMALGPQSESSIYRDWANAISEIVSAPIRIILDGMDRLSTEAPSVSFIRVLVEELPQHIKLMVLSRREPPFEVQGRKIKQQLHVLTNEDLAFTLEESQSFFREIRGWQFSSASLKRILQFTEGWIGGFILLAESLERMPEDSREKYVKEEMPDRFKAVVFQYFGEEVFVSQPISIQDFLVKTSILKSIDPGFAKDLVGITNVEEVLQDLVRRGLFVHRIYEDEKGWLFRYHQLFKDFLSSRLKGMFSEQERQSLFLRAASLYEERGDLQESLKHYLQAKDYSKAAAIIERIGMDFLRLGKTGDLANWLGSIPQDLVRKSPWLLFYLSMTRRFTRTAENLHSLNDALSLFSVREDLSGQLLSLAFLIEASALKGHDLIPISFLLEQAERLLGSMSADLYPYERATLWLQVGFALTVRGGNPRRGFWACENAYLISRGLRDFMLQVHALVNSVQALSWLCEFELVDEKVRELEKLVEKHPSLGVRLMSYTARCESMLFRGHLEKAEELLQHAKNESEKTGLTYLYPITLVYELMLKPHLGQYREAEETGNRLLSFSATIGNTVMMGISLMYLSRSHYFEGEYQRAGKSLKKARELLSSDKTRAEYHLHLISVLSGFISYHLQEYREVEENLQVALNHFAELRSFVMVETQLAMALVKWGQAKTEEAKAYLEAGLKLAEQRRYHHFTLTKPHDLLGICILALDLEVFSAMDYAAHLLCTRLASLARSEMIRLDDHPNKKIREKAREIRLTIHRSTVPRLRIETLGAFRVFRADSPMMKEDWQGSQPQNLLKGIVSHGGEGVSKEVLIDELWPQSRADAAEKTFKAALHRLRKALEPGMDKSYGSTYIHLKENRIYLDRELCEVDVNEFSSLLEKGNQRQTKNDPKGALSCYKNAIDLYKGDFIPEDLYAAWAESKRQELREKYVVTLMKVGGVYEKRGSLNKACAYYRRAIHADPVLEAAYQRLMVIYSHQGKRNEAMKVYQQCEKALQEELDAEPDKLTQSLYKRIL